MLGAMPMLENLSFPCGALAKLSRQALYMTPSSFDWSMHAFFWKGMKGPLMFLKITNSR